MADEYNKVVHYGLTTLPPILVSNIVNTVLDAIAVLNDDMAQNIDIDVEPKELNFDID